ncbi:hypothetical protein [Actinoplanes xinjiangensis]|uniref:hypothetical protein n=1 Tax=Actinoplanes xinjiangensis TaxID=512350 RepID=UPI00344972F7
MDMGRCGRVMCALMIGLHTAWAVTYQGSPDKASASAVASAPSHAERLEQRGKFDSEERPRDVEHRLQATGTSPGGGGVQAVGHATFAAVGTLGTGTVAPVEAETEDSKSKFDSEPRPQDINPRDSAANTVGGGNDVRVYPQTAYADGTAYAATVVTLPDQVDPVEPKSKFDSEPRPQDANPRDPGPGSSLAAGVVVRLSESRTRWA